MYISPNIKQVILTDITKQLDTYSKVINTPYNAAITFENRNGLIAAIIRWDTLLFTAVYKHNGELITWRQV